MEYLKTAKEAIKFIERTKAKNFLHGVIEKHKPTGDAIIALYGLKTGINERIITDSVRYAKRKIALCVERERRLETTLRIFTSHD